MRPVATAPAPAPGNYTHRQVDRGGTREGDGQWGWGVSHDLWLVLCVVCVAAAAPPDVVAAIVVMWESPVQADDKAGHQ